MKNAIPEAESIQRDAATYESRSSSRAEIGGLHNGVCLDLVGRAMGDHDATVEAVDPFADASDEVEVMVNDHDAGSDQ